MNKNNELHAAGLAVFLNYSLSWQERFDAYAWAFAAAHLEMKKLSTDPFVIADARNLAQKLECAEYSARKCNEICRQLLRSNR